MLALFFCNRGGAIPLFLAAAAYGLESVAWYSAADGPSVCRSNWSETTLLGKWLCRRFDKKADVLEFEAVENWNGECETGERFEVSDCNNKLIGARWFIDGAQDTGPNEFDVRR